MTLPSRPFTLPSAFSKAPFRRSSAAMRSGLETWIPVPVGNLDLEGSAGAASADGVLFSEAIEAEGDLVFAKACEMGLEGIVSKRAGSLYRSGRSRNWLKTRNPAFVRI